MTAQMQQVRVRSMDAVDLEVVAAPRPAAAEVLVRTVLVGICGSDVHACLGNHPFIDLPYQPGHEAVGVVEATGAEVDNFAVGDRVVVEPNLHCGRCPQCKAGRYNICQFLQVFGCQTPGAMAERFTIAADRVHPIPDALSDELAILIEPMATPVHAVAKAGDLRGRSVAVLGAGPIGLFVLLAAKHAGASRVLVTDLLESKRERALRMGADAVLAADDGRFADRARAELGAAADVVFDCVSREQSVAQAVDLVTKGGLVVIIGVGQPGNTPIRLDLVQDRELRIEGALMYVSQDFRTAMELIGSGVVVAAELISSVFPLREAAAAFAAARDPAQVKVLVRVSGQPVTATYQPRSAHV